MRFFAAGLRFFAAGLRFFAAGHEILSGGDYDSMRRDCDTFIIANVACRIAVGAVWCNIGKENGEYRGFCGQSCTKSMSGDF